ncbi:MAG: Spx/MgsR family RNA polymerase-binding regulatory protein [Planctomycetota bacterium]
MAATSPTIRFYGYMKCDTCRRARKWLDAQAVAYEWIDITRDPPSAAALRTILDAGRYGLKQLFNISGQSYRALNLKDRLDAMDEAEAVALLAADGKLIKRPVVTDDRRHTVGFRAAVYEEVWG